MRVGILALQGGYQAHASRLLALGVEVTLIKSQQDFHDIDRLVLPGGESTVMLKLLETEQLVPLIMRHHQQRKPILGTCAGTILLAKTILPSQNSFGLIDITVTRNAYGRQVDSCLTQGSWLLDNSEMAMMFIRAPSITSQTEDVQQLARYEEQAVCVQQGHILACTFHPELTEDDRVHQYFLTLA